MGLPEPPIQGQHGTAYPYGWTAPKHPLGRCAPRPRKSPDHPKGTQYRPEQEAPGRSFFSQILILLIPLQRLHADLVVQNPLPQAEGLEG